MAEPSLVLAKLDDDKLKDSINSLVNHLESSLERMKKSTTNAVQDMQQTLQSLGNIKVDTGGSADGGSSKRAKKQREETQAVNDTVAAYDKLAEAQQKASRKKDIEYMSLPSDVQEGLTYLVNVNKDVDSQLDSIIQKERAMIAEREKEAQLAREIAEQQSRIAVAPNGYAIGNSRETNKSVGVDLQRLKEATVGTEEFTQAIARLTNKQEYEINLANADTDSYNRLAKTLKDLQTAYNNMTAAERKSENGLSIRASIIEVEQAINRIKREASRPVSLDSILKIDPKTLDEVVEKMRLLQSYRGGIDITKPTAKKELEDVNQELNKLQKKQREIMGQDKQMTELNNALSRSWNYMKNRLAFYFTVGASTQFVKGLIDIRGQYEMLERSIAILFDSMQTGSKIFAELNSMAIESPFTTMELGAAAKQLSAYNIAAKDVVDTTRRLADIAAAVGIPIERLTYALGQIKSYGYLNSRDARMFANAGIPLIQNLADMYTKLEGRLVSIGDVYDRIKKKQISFEDTVKVINEMTDEGGRFFNFQEKSADTLKVKLANLNLAYNNFLNELGKSSQSTLEGVLVSAKNILDSWKNIDALMNTILHTLGIVKSAQLLYLLGVKGVTAQLALQEVFGKKIASVLIGLGKNFFATISNPYTWIAGAIVYLGYLGEKLIQLAKENEVFNQSISKAAKENIDSIDKFVKDYGKDIETVNSLNVSDQTKLWERVREEIEKTSKNASAYVELLESIPDIAERVTSASDFFEQEKRIQDEAKRLADIGTFSVGGGFGDDPLARNLIEYENNLNRIIKLYGDMDTAIKKSAIYKKSGQDQYSPLEYLRKSTMETEKELQNFVEILDKADIYKIIGDYKSDAEALANIREFSNIVRDNFLTTDEGQKISIQGQARLNAALDAWIAKKGESLDLIEKENFAIESNRTAWEQFFGYLSSKDRKVVDYLIATHKTGSEEFQKIWDKAANEMSKNSTAAYMQIQQQIANLRNTPDIVINLVYRSTKETLDDQQKEFEKKWITPSRWLERGLSTAQYLEEENVNRKKYGRLMRKTGEDNVEWEKRLGEEYQENVKSIKSLNDQLAKGKKLSDVDKEAKKKELDEITKINKALKEIGDAQGFNYEQFKKGGKNKKDVLGEAFKDEVEIIQNIQKRYKEYRKEGVSAQDAISKATDEYGKTLVRVNSTLNKYGVKTKKSDELANMDMRSLRSYYTSLLNMASALGNAKGVEALEKAIAGLNVEITKVDYKTILDGLNSQLGKLKEDYELSVELDANPELGTMFTDLFKIDTNTLPKDIYDYIEKIQGAVDDAIKASDKKLSTFDILGIDADKWAKDSGVEIGSDLYKNIEAAQKQARSAMKRYVTDVNKQTKDLQYKLADTNGKIAIEEENLARLQQQLANETHEEKKHLLELQIQEEENAIDKLKEEVLQLLPTYVNLFNSIAEHSTAVTRKLAKQWKEALENAVPNGEGYTVTDPISGEQSTISREQLGRQLDKVNKKLRETQSSFRKIKESFTKGEDGIVDWAKGIEQISDELKKMSELTSVIGDIAEALGNKNEYNETAEALHDIANTMSGIAEAGDGVAKIAAGDYIGGTTSLIKGAWTAISTWLDNDNKEIDAKIKSSELAVKRLELAYVDLEHAIEDAYGTATIAAKKAAIANKELQLAELKRQLTLEQSRDSKDRDDDRIIELQKQIKELQYDIKEASDEIINDLLGISSVGDAMDSLMDNFIEALRNGEDAMKVFDESVNNMIANMVKKMYVTKILQPWFENAWKTVQSDIEQRSKSLIDWVNYVMESFGTTDAKEALTKLFKDGSLMQVDPKTWVDMQRKLGIMSEEILSQIDTSSFDAFINSLAAIYESGGLTLDDIKRYADVLRDGRDSLGVEMDSLEDYLKELGLMNASKNLSALQQGIMGITEDTAGALEAITNGISQQSYLQSDLLTQIRDTILGFDLDIQMGVLGEILLQLQSSYQIQMSIRNTLQGWSNASGMAVRVEMV